MNYQIGMKLIWIPDSKFDAHEGVTVTELRSRGQARLSNGWTVNADGVAEGNRRVSGGKVEPFEDPDDRVLRAAPDLLAAVRFLVTTSAPMTTQQKECWPGLLAAFAKATGEAS